MKWRDLMNIKETKFGVENRNILLMGGLPTSLYPLNRFGLLFAISLFCLLFCFALLS